MWDAGVYPLSVLIALLSGGWPYLKLLLIGVCWVCPLRVRRRETILQWLDALGKWSLLDSYVMVAMMVAFNFKVLDSRLQGAYFVENFISSIPIVHKSKLVFTPMLCYWLSILGWVIFIAVCPFAPDARSTSARTNRVCRAAKRSA